MPRSLQILVRNLVCIGRIDVVTLLGSKRLWRLSLMSCSRSTGITLICYFLKRQSLFKVGYGRLLMLSSKHSVLNGLLEQPGLYQKSRMWLGGYKTILLEAWRSFLDIDQVIMGEASSVDQDRDRYWVIGLQASRLISDLRYYQLPHSTWTLWICRSLKCHKTS